MNEMGSRQCYLGIKEQHLESSISHQKCYFFIFLFCILRPHLKLLPELIVVTEHF